MSEALRPFRQEWIDYMATDSPDGYWDAEPRAEAEDRWDRAIAAHDREVKAAALREYAALVEEIANLGANNTGLRTPHHLAEYTRNYANRIESQETP